MEKGNPHAIGAGASLSIGPDANAPSIPIPLNSIAKGIPPAAVLRVLAQHSRKHLEGFIEVAITLLDLADGDPDQEPNGDERDGSTAEDDWWPHGRWKGEAGCPISDPGGCEHDGREPALTHDIDQTIPDYLPVIDLRAEG